MGIDEEADVEPSSVAAVVVAVVEGSVVVVELLPERDDVPVSLGEIGKGRQSVTTLQWVQSKVSVPTRDPLAVPLNCPLASMLTPEKSIHPSPSPQAEPLSVPLPLLTTPLLVGARLIQPVFSFQA